ncbi:hypothetical protein [Embleya sp. NPDC005575]|uniref:hypothetical protein n=1 Tax=Embleya sp. NPDC005575 TaxID=3156892 RepID=UPI0033BB9C16
MQKALAAFTQGEEEQDFAVHHAGVALEHLLKSYLASLHPVLVVESKPDNFLSLLHAIGRGTTPVTTIKTIGLSEAFTRVKHLLTAEIPIDAKLLRPVMEARNGVAHCAIHDHAATATNLALVIKVVDPVLAALRLDTTSDWYWGDYGELRESLIAKRNDALRVRISAKVARAKAVYARRRSEFSRPEQWAEVMAMITDGIGGHICPACENPVLHSGEVVHVEMDLVPSEAGDGLTQSAKATFHSKSLKCEICHLELNEEELVHQGLADSVELVPTEDYHLYVENAQALAWTAYERDVGYSSDGDEPVDEGALEETYRMFEADG